MQTRARLTILKYYTLYTFRRIKRTFYLLKFYKNQKNLQKEWTKDFSEKLFSTRNISKLQLSCPLQHTSPR